MQAIVCPFAIAQKGVSHLEHLAHILLSTGLHSRGPEESVSSLQSVTHLHRLLALGEDVVIKTAGTSLHALEVHLNDMAGLARHCDHDHQVSET